MSQVQPVDGGTFQQVLNQDIAQLGSVFLMWMQNSLQGQMQDVSQSAAYDPDDPNADDV